MAVTVRDFHDTGNRVDAGPLVAVLQGEKWACTVWVWEKQYQKSGTVPVHLSGGTAASGRLV